jgi:hypothetical protein
MAAGVRGGGICIPTHKSQHRVSRFHRDDQCLDDRTRPHVPFWRGSVDRRNSTAVPAPEMNGCARPEANIANKASMQCVWSNVPRI